jgi:uncharacterized membrane protein
MPHPKHLREYDEILPGSAERIIAMAERNLEHNMNMDRIIMTAEISDRKLGMFMGFGLFLLLTAGAFASLFVTANPAVPLFFLESGPINLLERRLLA